AGVESGARRRRAPTRLRLLADLRDAANPRRRGRRGEAVRSVARSRRGRDGRQRRAGVLATEAPAAHQWQLPKLRVDRNGDWFDDDVEITHAGILANLRSGLKRD